MAIIETANDCMMSHRYKTWFDNLPNADDIILRLEDPDLYQVTADRFESYLRSRSTEELVPPSRLLQLARQLQSKERYLQASVVYQLLVIQNPNEVQGWLGQALMFRLRGQLTKTLTSLQEAANISNCHQAAIESEIQNLQHQLMR